MVADESTNQWIDYNRFSSGFFWLHSSDSSDLFGVAEWKYTVKLQGKNTRNITLHMF